MRKVYHAENPIWAGHVQSLLEENGIDCLVKNQNLSGAMGELPVNECWPEVWVMHEDDYDNAQQLIQATLAVEHTAFPAWSCTCGEIIEGQFGVCWNYGQVMAET